MLWGDGCKNIEEYYNKCVGVPVQLLPTVLGLKLAVDLDLGSKYVSASFQRCIFFNSSHMKRNIGRLKFFFVLALHAIKGAQSRYFEVFWPRTKLPLN